MAVCSVIIIGMVTSVYGLYKSLSLNAKVAMRGVRVELAGLWVAMSGPFAYMATQVYILTQPEPGDRIAQIAICYLLMSFIFVRIVIITSHRKRAQS